MPELEPIIEELHRNTAEFAEALRFGQPVRVMMSDADKEEVRDIVREEMTTLAGWTNDQMTSYSSIMERLILERMLRRSKAGDANSS